MNDNVISFEINKIVFEANDSNFKIVRATSLDNNKNYSVKGDMEGVKLYERYDATVKDKETNKWGTTYIISSIIPQGLGEGISDNDTMMLFLKHYVSDAVHDKCEVVYDNIYDIITERKEDELLKVYGIGKKTKNKIFSIWEKRGKEIKMVAKLLSLGLDSKSVDKIKHAYCGNLTDAIRDLDKDIYNLMYKNVGINFDKINAIADGLDYKEDDIRRIKALIYKNIKHLAEVDYRSWITMVDFFGISEIYEMIDTLGVEVVQEAFELLISERRIIRLKTDEYDICGLYSQYKLELELVNRIEKLSRVKFEIKDIDFDKEIEIEENTCGFKFTDTQKEAIKQGVIGSFVSIVGSAGCVDADTEYFNGTEWVKISEYNKEDKVLIYDKDGSARLEYPQNYIKEKCETMTLMTNSSRSINQCLSDDHRLMYTSAKTMQPKFIQFKDFKEEYNKNKLGFNGFILSAFNYSNTGIDLTDEEIRVMVMTIADGSFRYKNTNNCILHIKKQRKVDRAKKLLDNANIKYTVYKCSNGYTNFRYYPPRKEKEFTSYWYGCDKHQFEIITEECVYWDGCNRNNGRKEFSTCNKKTADFIQFAYTSLGKRCVVREYDRRGEFKPTNEKLYERKSIEYSISFTNQNKLGLRLRDESRPRLNFEDYKTKDGYKYCFTVETGMLVLRREGRIFITGNCGKTSISRAILNIIERNDPDFNLTQCTLSGRAGRVLSESNGRDARTIASILYSNDDLFCNVLMIDELSMVDLNSFLQLLKKIPYGTKIITMGDKKQLPSLSIGKMINDLELFDSVTTIELTEVHRQALDSGILVMANDLIKDKTTITKNGEHILGELQDMYIDANNNGMTKAIRKAIELYKKEDMFDVQMICATNSLCFQANTDVQKILGKAKGDYIESKTKIKVEGEYVKYKIYKNDKIMIIKNNYNISLADDYRDGITNGHQVLFNGEMGIVTEVNSSEGYIFAEFDGIEYAISEDYFDDIVLGYACTVHKMQGDSAKYIIGFTNNSYVEKGRMLSNEWLYTLITRTRDKCWLYSTLNEIDICVKNRSVNSKATFIEILCK